MTAVSNGERWERDAVTGEWRPVPLPTLPPWKRWYAEWLAHNLILWFVMAALGVAVLVIGLVVDVLRR